MRVNRKAFAASFIGVLTYESIQVSAGSKGTSSVEKAFESLAKHCFNELDCDSCVDTFSKVNLRIKSSLFNALLPPITSNATDSIHSVCSGTRGFPQEPLDLIPTSEDLSRYYDCLNEDFSRMLGDSCRRLQALRDKEIAKNNDGNKILPARHLQLNVTGSAEDRGLFIATLYTYVHNSALGETSQVASLPQSIRRLRAELSSTAPSTNKGPLSEIGNKVAEEPTPVAPSFEPTIGPRPTEGTESTEAVAKTSSQASSSSGPSYLRYVPKPLRYFIEQFSRENKAPDGASKKSESCNEACENTSENDSTDLEEVNIVGDKTVETIPDVPLMFFESTLGERLNYDEASPWHSDGFSVDPDDFRPLKRFNGEPYYGYTSRFTDDASRNTFFERYGEFDIREKARSTAQVDARPKRGNAESGKSASVPQSRVGPFIPGVITPTLQPPQIPRPDISEGESIIMRSLLESDIVTTVPHIPFCGDKQQKLIFFQPPSDQEAKKNSLSAWVICNKGDFNQLATPQSRNSFIYQPNTVGALPSVDGPYKILPGYHVFLGDAPHERQAKVLKREKRFSATPMFVPMDPNKETYLFPADVHEAVPKIPPETRFGDSQAWNSNPYAPFGFIRLPRHSTKSHDRLNDAEKLLVGLVAEKATELGKLEHIFIPVGHMQLQQEFSQFKESSRMGPMFHEVRAASHLPAAAEIFQKSAAEIDVHPSPPMTSPNAPALIETPSGSWFSKQLLVLQINVDPAGKITLLQELPLVSSKESNNPNGLAPQSGQFKAVSHQFEPISLTKSLQGTVELKEEIARTFKHFYNALIHKRISTVVDLLSGYWSSVASGACTSAVQFVQQHENVDASKQRVSLYASGQPSAQHAVQGISEVCRHIVSSSPAKREAKLGPLFFDIRDNEGVALIEMRDSVPMDSDASADQNLPSSTARPWSFEHIAEKMVEEAEPKLDEAGQQMKRAIENAKPKLDEVKQRINETVQKAEPKIDEATQKMDETIKKLKPALEDAAKRFDQFLEQAKRDYQKMKEQFDEIAKGWKERFAADKTKPSASPPAKATNKEPLPKNEPDVSTSRRLAVSESFENTVSEVPTNGVNRSNKYLTYFRLSDEARTFEEVLSFIAKEATAEDLMGLLERQIQQSQPQFRWSIWAVVFYLSCGLFLIGDILIRYAWHKRKRPESEPLIVDMIQPEYHFIKDQPSENRI